MLERYNNKIKKNKENNENLFYILENKYKEIMAEHETVQDLFRRQVIVDFVENYRTSYNRKDLEYIESVKLIKSKKVH